MIMRQAMLIMLVIGLVGCGKPKDEPAPAEPAEVVDENAAINTLFEQARAHYDAGDTDAAVAMLTDGLADPQFAGNQPTLFRALLELLLMENRVTDAQTSYLAILHASPETAVQTFSMIPAHLRRQEDTSAYLAWCEQMVNADLPSNIVESAYGFYVDANVQAGLDDKLASLAETTCDRFGGATAARIFARPVTALVEKEKYDVAEQVLARLMASGDKSAMDFVTGIEMTMDAVRGEWDRVVATFEAKASGLPDNNAKLALRTIDTHAVTAQRTDVVDRLCEFVLKSMPDAVATRTQAMVSFLNVAVKAARYDDAVARLQRMREWGAAPDVLGSRISSVFYELMGKASAESGKAALDLIAWLLAETTDSKLTAQYQALMMDGAVLCDDYRRAMDVLESGFRADDPEWHSMAINKVGAHMALQEGRIDDAVAMFRKFMEHVATWTETTVDPSTGISYTREMSLGFNAQRIGNILRDADRADEAAAAYAEARGYYQTALESAKPDSKELAYIKEQMASLPETPPAP